MDDFPAPLEDQRLNEIHAISFSDYNNRVTAVYLVRDWFSYLWFIPSRSSSGGYVGFLNLLTNAHRQNYYNDQNQAIKTYNLCKNTLNTLEDHRLVWEGKQNNAQES